MSGHPRLTAPSTSKSWRGWTSLFSGLPKSAWTNLVGAVEINGERPRGTDSTTVVASVKRRPVPSADAPQSMTWNRRAKKPARVHSRRCCGPRMVQLQKRLSAHVHANLRRAETARRGAASS